MKRGLLLAALALACCERAPSAGPARATATAKVESPDVGAVEPAREQRVAPPPLRTPRAHVLRVRSVTGSVAGAPSIAAGAELTQPTELQLGDAAQLELALDDYAVVRVSGPAALSLLPEGEPALLLREGLVSVDCAPRAARSTESAFWLATSMGRLDVVAGARFVVDAHAGRASELFVVSGHVGVRGLAQDGLLVGAPALHCLGGRARRAISAMKLEAAESALATRSLCSNAGGPRAAPTLLQASLSVLHGLAERERALLAEHARLLVAAAPEARAVPRQLATLAVEGVGEREQARTLRASLEAQQLGRPSSDRERRLVERARELAPYRD